MLLLEILLYLDAVKFIAVDDNRDISIALYVSTQTEK